MKYILVFVIGIAIGANGFWGWRAWKEKNKIDIPEVLELPLLKYSIKNLSARTDWNSEILLGEIVATESGFTLQRFEFISDGKKVSGVIHQPDVCNKCPVIAQFRGYFPRDKYYQGAGTQKTAIQFAKAGYITIAPDFLGYGESASPSANVWEARFETYTTAANLLMAVEKWEKTESIGVWAHSNGGQIALTALEITGKGYPTALWAPVTAPFPYSVLYYTFDYDDHGKELRKSLAEFERDYDVDQFALVNYLDRITAPVFIQQGTADSDIPLKWSRGITSKLKEIGKDIEYLEYLGADHNLFPRWAEAVETDIEFFDRHLK